jgi:hypothetical protein
MLLEAHKRTEKGACGWIVDEIVPLEELDAVALRYAEKWAAKAKMGVYGLLRNEASLAFRTISYVLQGGQQSQDIKHLVL